MIANLNHYCSLVKWFIMGGVRPLNIDNEHVSEKDNKVYANWWKLNTKVTLVMPPQI